MSNALRITVTGTRIHTLLALRVKEYERHITRAAGAIEVLRGDIIRIENDSTARLTAAHERARRAPLPGGGGHYGGTESVGVGEVVNLRGQLDRLENNTAALVYEKNQVAWLSEQFSAMTSYELDAGDLAILGLGARVGRGGSGFDALEV